MSSAAAAEDKLSGLAGVDSEGKLKTVLVDLPTGKQTESFSYPTTLTAADGTQQAVSVLAISSRKTGDYNTPEGLVHRQA